HFSAALPRAEGFKAVGQKSRAGLVRGTEDSMLSGFATARLLCLAQRAVATHPARDFAIEPGAGAKTRLTKRV
ncbi:MAG: hypothetical protein ACKO9H_15760, partial [Planctomycetota bacterium]